MAVESPVGNDFARQITGTLNASSHEIARMVMHAIDDEDARHDPAASITQHSVMTIGPFFRAVAILAGLIGRLDLQLKVLGKNNRSDIADDDERNFLVEKKPHANLRSSTWRQQMQVHCMLTPGGFTEIIRDPGNPNKATNILALMPLDPNYVLYGVIRDKNKIERTVYFYFDNPESLTPRPIEFDDMIHVKGLSYNGVMGIDPINVMRQDLGLATSRRGYAKMYFHSNGQIRGFMEVPPSVSPEKFINFMMTVQALASERSMDPSKTIPLFDGIQFKPYQDNPENSQLVESLSMTPEMVSSWTGVPQMLLGSVKESSYNALEQVMRGFFTITVDAILREFETELDDKLLTEKELKQRRLSFRFDRSTLNALLVAEFHKMIRDDFSSGLLSWEEARIALSRHTDASDGHFFLPQNLVGSNPIQVGGDPTAPRENNTKDDPKSNRKPATEKTPASSPANYAIKRNAEAVLKRICNRLTKAFMHAAEKPNLQKQLEAIDRRERSRIKEDIDILNDLSLASGLINQHVHCDILNQFRSDIVKSITEHPQMKPPAAIQLACQSASDAILREFTCQLTGESADGTSET